MSGIRHLVLVWLALLGLLALTVAGSFVLAGPASLLLSTGVALGKAALIFWFYMHLREEGGIARLAALGAGAWLLVLFVLSASDYATRAAG